VTEASSRVVALEGEAFFVGIAEVLERALRNSRGKDHKAVAIAQAMRRRGRGASRS
jgi:hypothetical protein